MATIHDVARLAGVSAATVSRVTNGRGNVAPGLAERVRRAMAELDYRPNAAARKLRRSPGSLWAVVISDIGNAFFTSLVRGIEDVAQERGFSLVLCNSDEDPRKEGQYVTAVLAERMAGVIMSPCAGSGQAARLVAGGVPVVAIDRRLPGPEAVDTVLVDNEAGARRAVTHLFEAGYRRIACVTGPRGVPTAEQRLAGYLGAMAGHGLTDPGPLVRHADFREGGGYDAMAELLRLRPAPDAVFTANNLMTVGALECLADHGVTVPDRMGVVGFDEIPWATLVRPSLTTVVQPTRELGRTAARLLADRLADPARPATTTVLPTELRLRDSSVRTGPAPRGTGRETAPR
ncbi:LacI family DNA-binding transcriptional regulator [Streptomyces hoynatensis]|uniref:LacI family transcriptional regulator n=1 Tax=Streptomyces hoynatensis TaxID=1141874 RepID=A0A3A9Z6X7_9ACTN|nr:LacI family DNA-binding transcriptional regulator [Streptomyces hoynatensis]RKN44023.1 LacI family transcriptional regulator [Streptomyces hoynatensis]